MASPARVPLPRTPRVLPHAPEELIRQRLIRLGEGVGKVMYASPHWVVKRERSPTEIVAVIVVWKILRKVARLLPHPWRERFVNRPSQKIRLFRTQIQAFIAINPPSFCCITHIGEVWRVYHWRNVRGESLAQAHLAGTELVPGRILFPPTRVRVAGWPGYLLVHEVTGRVESTLPQRLLDLAASGRFNELERWLERLLKQPNLPRGAVHQPHQQLGLASALRDRPDVAARFNARWKAIVNREHVLLQWLGDL
jgi:hypothetical protein